jgi:mannan polymerase II complex MNN10 subunit
MSPTRRRPFFSRPSNPPLKLGILTFCLLILTYFHRSIPSLSIPITSFTTISSSTTSTQQPPQSPSLPKIAIITFTTTPTTYTHLSLSNHAAYAAQNNYDLFVDYSVSNSRDVMWGKFDMLQRIIERGGYEWVWWMDFDTLITNMTTRVEDVIEEGLQGAERQGKRKEDVDWLFTADW